MSIEFVNALQFHRWQEGAWWKPNRLFSVGPKSPKNPEIVPTEGSQAMGNFIVEAFALPSLAILLLCWFILDKVTNCCPHSET